VSDERLDRMVADASPVIDDDVAALDLGAADAELMEAIVATRIEEENDVREPVRRRTRVRAIAAATAIAAVSLIAAGIVTGGGSQPPYGALARSVAEANPRILPGTPGWEVVRADEFTVDHGEMTFSDGTRSMDVHWEPADQYRDHVEKGSIEGEDRSEIEVLGRRGTIWRYKGTTDYVTVLSPESSTYTYFRGDLGSENAYRAVLADLRSVSVDEWLDAMPESVVRPDARAATVDAMLRDIPLPPDFDTAPLRTGEAVKDRYQLGAQVTGAVACGWLDRWTLQLGSGNQRQADEATAAMQTSHEWDVLLEMNDEGDYPEVLWEIADAMQHNGAGGVPSGKGMVPLTRENYGSALGCDTR
jgi:hypothetical protein